MKKINTVAFITGARSDYGKLKPLIKEVEKNFNTQVYVCGMHLIEEFGNTYKDIISDGYKNVYCADDIFFTGNMDIDFANTVISLNKFNNLVKPDIIVVHGDRIEALAGAVSGMLNNIAVAHIEGGEITGTVDESIRHSISKMAQFHFVANFESKVRLQQLGEKEQNIYIIGSPDIDIMLSELPSLESVKEKYNIKFDDYAIFIYHPVTTETSLIKNKTFEVISGIEESNRNYIIIYPNNDLGSNVIIDEIEKLRNNNRFNIFRSLPFEEFLSLLKGSQFIIGNSSAGIREACVYGIPSIDIGTRQQGRYNEMFLKNIQHVKDDTNDILYSIGEIDFHRFKSYYFGDGNSAIRFIDILKSLDNTQIQKKFVDGNETQEAIKNYINEVCF